VVEGRLEPVEELVLESRRLLGPLLALTYDADPAVAWKAVEATGAACARLADRDPGAVREHLRRLFWLITEESGGICWRAPETMADIVARRPDLFGDYVPIVTHLLAEMADEDLEHFRPGIQWAIGRLGPLAREAAGGVLEKLVGALDHDDARVRGTAVWCLGRLGYTEALASREDLRADPGLFELYEEGELRSTTVGDTVTEALS
jgi:HEAT repeat protein